MPSEQYRINSPPVVLETIDEETIIVNLDTGSYFDLNHSGGRVLQALEAGTGVDVAIDGIADAYGVARELVVAPVETLVAQLLEEGIISAAQSVSGAGDRPVGDPPATAKAYEAPALAKYTDMQELLLLDPVHEVDGAGWPNKV